MTRPLIGMVTQSLNAVAGERSASWMIGRKYIDVLTHLGALAWPIPLISSASILQEIFDRLDGVLLTGGADVDPQEYRERKHDYCGPTHPDRDMVEREIIRYAETHQLPVFGICRGLQMLNVAYGGTLYQDIATQVPAAIPHENPPNSGVRNRISHEITVRPDTKLYDMLKSTHVAVNSLHHQSIKDLAAGFEATAYAPDGIIEAIERKGDRFLLAVQWHPEELALERPEMMQFFQRFLEQAAIRADQRNDR